MLILLALLLVGACVQPGPYPVAPSYNYVVPTTTYLRDCPGYECGIVTDLYSGDRVVVLDRNDFGWARVQLDRTGAIGWIAGDLLSYSPVPATFYVSLVSVYLRNCADYNCPAVELLHRGDQVDKLAQDGRGALGDLAAKLLHAQLRVVLVGDAAGGELPQHQRIGVGVHLGVVVVHAGTAEPRFRGAVQVQPGFSFMPTLAASFWNSVPGPEVGKTGGWRLEADEPSPTRHLAKIRSSGDAVGAVIRPQCTQRTRRSACGGPCDSSMVSSHTQFITTPGILRVP